jgi:hypothetical protein
MEKKKEVKTDCPTFFLFYDFFLHNKTVVLVSTGIGDH